MRFREGGEREVALRLGKTVLLCINMDISSFIFIFSVFILQLFNIQWCALRHIKNLRFIPRILRVIHRSLPECRWIHHLSTRIDLDLEIEIQHGQ